MKTKLKNKDLNKVIGGLNNNEDINRNLDINKDQSDIGTTEDNNAIPGEIKPKQH